MPINYLDDTGWDWIDSYAVGANSDVSWDTGTISPIYGMYKIVLFFYNSSGSTNTVKLSLNADSSSNYRYEYNEQGSVKTETGDTEFPIIAIEPSETFVGNIYITGEWDSDAFPSVSASIGAHSYCPRLIAGRLSVLYQKIDKIKIWDSGNNGQMGLRLYGLDLFG